MFSPADRRPIDPAPIVQLRVITHDQPVRNGAHIDTASAPPPVERKLGQGSPKPATPGVRGGVPVSTSLGDGWEDKAWYLENPYLFMYAMLCHAETDEELHLLNDGKTRYTSGSCVSCLYHLKDIDGSHQGFFVFPDLSIRVEGRYRLKLCLFEIIGQSVHHCKSVYSDPFHVYTAKRFPGMEESTRLSRSFAEQGLKVRVRKHPRSRRRESKRQKPDSDASDPDQQAPHDPSLYPSKKPRSSDASSSGTRPSVRHLPGTSLPDDRSGFPRQLLSPEQSRLPPSRRMDGWDAEASRLRAAGGREPDYDYNGFHRAGREREMVYAGPGPEPLYRDAYTMRERGMYQRPTQRLDNAGPSGLTRQEQNRGEMSRMPPPMQLAPRHGDFAPSEYAQPYSSYGRASPDRVYARSYPPPDYMTYEERRAFEDHHARARLEGGNPYDPRGSTGYLRTPSPDPMASYSADMASRLSRPTFQVSEHPAARRQAEMSGHASMERMYPPRRSPPGPDVLYPPSGRVPDRQVYESDVYAGAPLANVRRISDPYLRVPATAAELSRHNQQRTGRMAPHPRDDGRAAASVLPPMSTSPHAVRRESASGLPMLPPREAMDPLSRPYASSFGYSTHADSAEAFESARHASREEEIEHRRTLFRATPASRPPPGPSRPK